MRERMSHTERRRQLLEVAFDCFSEKGYEGTTVTDMVRRAGVAKGTFFYYFPAKEDVLISLVENEVVGVLYRLRRNGKNRSALERLRLILDIIREPNRLEPIIDKMYESGEIRLVDVSWQVVQRLLDDEIRDIFGQGVREGTIHISDMDIAVEYYWAIVDRMMSREEGSEEFNRKRFTAAVGIIEYILGIEPGILA